VESFPPPVFLCFPPMPLLRGGSLRHHALLRIPNLTQLPSFRPDLLTPTPRTQSPAPPSPGPPWGRCLPPQPALPPARLPHVPLLGLTVRVDRLPLPSNRGQPRPGGGQHPGPAGQRDAHGPSHALGLEWWRGEKEKRPTPCTYKV